MSNEPAIFFFQVKPHDGRGFENQTTTQAIMARDQGAALAALAKDPPIAGIFDARCTGWMTRADLDRKIRDFYGVAPMEPVVAASAMRYAVAEHGSGMTDAERETIVDCARRIEERALAFLRQ